MASHKSQQTDDLIASLQLSNEQLKAKSEKHLLAFAAVAISLIGLLLVVGSAYTDLVSEYAVLGKTVAQNESGVDEAKGETKENRAHNASQDITLERHRGLIETHSRILSSTTGFFVGETPDR